MFSAILKSPKIANVIIKPFSIPKVAKNGQKEPFQQTFLKMNATTFFMHIHGFYDIYCITRVYFEGCMYIINEYKPKITKNAIIIEQFREKLIEIIFLSKSPP